MPQDCDNAIAIITSLYDIVLLGDEYKIKQIGPCHNTNIQTYNTHTHTHTHTHVHTHIYTHTYTNIHAAT